MSFNIPLIACSYQEAVRESYTNADVLLSSHIAHVLRLFLVWSIMGLGLWCDSSQLLPVVFPPWAQSVKRPPLGSGSGDYKWFLNQEAQHNLTDPAQLRLVQDVPVILNSASDGGFTEFCLSEGSSQGSCAHSG